MKLDFDDPHDGGDDADDGHANNEVSVHEGNDVAGDGGADEIGNGVTM